MKSNDLEVLWKELIIYNPDSQLYAISKRIRAALDEMNQASEAGLTIVDLANADADGYRNGRASVVVELPKMPTAQRTDEEATFSAGGCDMLRKCRAAILAAGGSVKE